jgi:Uma2 family endonuclease
MSTSPAPLRITPQQYLEAERRATFKSEYFDGGVYVRAGGTRRHSLIEANLAYEAVGKFRGRPCEVHGSNMNHGEVLENPGAIFEILSPSTEKYDRTAKFDGYCSIPTFTQYALISQEEPRVEVFSRTGESWIFTRFTGLDATATFPSLEIAIPLASLYDRIDFTQPDILV